MADFFVAMKVFVVALQFLMEPFVFAPGVWKGVKNRVAAAQVVMVELVPEILAMMKAVMPHAPVVLAESRRGNREAQRQSEKHSRQSSHILGPPLLIDGDRTGRGFNNRLPADI